MPSEVVGEGDVDRAIVKSLCAALNVPTPTREEPPGRIAAIKRASLALKLIGPRRIVLLLDRNGHSVEELKAEVAATLREVLGQAPAESGGWWLFSQSALRLVVAGLPGDECIKSLGVTKFMSDDYLLKLLLEDASLRAFCNGENQLSHRPTSGSELRGLLLEHAELLRKRGINVDTSKRYLHLVRAIIGFEASRAAMAEHLIKRCPQAIREQILGRLKLDLETDPPISA